MKRALICDDQVRALIHELTIDAEPPTGTHLRQVLHDRFGLRGGVSRVYRLLAQEKIRLKRSATPETLEQLLQQISELRERATLAEERERTHQLRWAAEVDRLRLALSVIGPSAQQARVALETNDWLKHRLAAAEARNASLEQKLLERENRLGAVIDHGESTSHGPTE